MRTIFFLIVLVICSAAQIYSQLPEKALRNMVVEHDIKSITQFNHKYSNGEPEEDGYKNFYKEFDKHGNLIKELHYRDGEVSQRMTYKYNEDQNKTEYENYNVRNDKLAYRQTIEYNENGNKITEKRFNGTEHLKLKYKYDENGKVDQILKKKLTGQNNYKLLEKRKFQHNGNTRKIKVLNPKNNLLKIIENKYDGKGEQNLTCGDNPRIVSRKHIKVGLDIKRHTRCSSWLSQ